VVPRTELFRSISAAAATPTKAYAAVIELAAIPVMLIGRLDVVEASTSPVLPAEMHCRIARIALKVHRRFS
jgi:hypothetical protein